MYYTDLLPRIRLLHLSSLRRENKKVHQPRDAEAASNLARLADASFGSLLLKGKGASL